MATSPPNVSLYTLHIEKAGYIRSTITSVKALLDDPELRQSLIHLNSVEGNLSALPYPEDLTGRIESLSVAIKNLEGTLSSIENGIRGTVLYPVQVS
jgi:hypothetical protein